MGNRCECLDGSHSNTLGAPIPPPKEMNKSGMSN